jgi:dihydroorotate dehydrogenase (fumarate)
LEDTGVDALECNFYASPKHPDKRGTEIEAEQIELVAALTQAVSIPVSIKLGVFYSNVLNVVHRMDDAGAAGFVLFNRFFEPDINVHTEVHISPFNLSHDIDYRLPLRYAALLEGNIKATVCGSTGIYAGEHMIKMLLAGASAVQIVSALMRHGYSHIQTMLQDMKQWMGDKGYGNLNDFRGKLSQRHVRDPWAYTRAQYASLLLNPELLLKNAPTM